MNSPGFNMRTGPGAPFQMIPHEVLAQLAMASFRPPPQQSPPPPAPIPGMGMSAPSAPGFNVGDGMAGLGMGLANWIPKGDVFMARERTAGDRDLAGYGASPADPMGGNPNAQPVEVFNPTGAASGGGFLDFLTGLFKR